MDAPTDPSLVASSDPREVAIPRLMDLYGSFLYKVGLRLCRSSEDAEDLIQETFLLAFRKWHQFKGRSDPKTWLYTIATRVSKRMYRRRAGQPRRIRSLDEPAQFGKPAAEEVPADQASALAEQIQRERQERIEQAIMALPANYRVSFVLKDVLEFSVSEIAEIFGMKEATIKSRIRRARLSVRGALAKTPGRQMPPLAYSRQVCLDLAQAKQAAADRGVEFPLPEEVVCQRCSAFFSTMSLIHDQCRDIVAEKLPLAGDPKAREKTHRP